MLNFLPSTFFPAKTATQRFPLASIVIPSGIPSTPFALKSKAVLLLPVHSKVFIEVICYRDMIMICNALAFSAIRTQFSSSQIKVKSINFVRKRVNVVHNAVIAGPCKSVSNINLISMLINFSSQIEGIQSTLLAIQFPCEKNTLTY